MILLGFACMGIFAGDVYAEEEEKEIMIFVENDARKVYYGGVNIKSVFYDHSSASVTFETGMNAQLKIKVPQIYQTGPLPFILKNNEEIIPENITTDNCFYYIDIESETPEKFEFIFASWPEYPETKKENECEIFTVSPLWQFKNGVEAWEHKMQMMD